MLTACTSNQPSAAEAQLTEPLSAAVQAKLAKFYPAALAWYNQTEQELLTKGRPLTSDEQAIARKLGIKQPEKVRILALKTFPLPKDQALQAEAERYGLGSPNEGGRTMGYAVLLKAGYANDKTLLTHELVHVQQIERLGQAEFIKRYLIEMETVGYAHSPLELEAYNKQTLQD